MEAQRATMSEWYQETDFSIGFYSTVYIPGILKSGCGTKLLYLRMMKMTNQTPNMPKRT